MGLCVLIILLSCIRSFAPLQVGTKTKDMVAHVGTVAELPCRVDRNQCGNLHSVKWYKDTSRIYVLSHAGSIKRPEGDAKERMQVEYPSSGGEAVLKISDVKVEDEAIYKCEITYLEVRESCDVVQIVNLTTFIKPEVVRIFGLNGVSMGNGSILGPKEEGEEVDLVCEAGSGKPIPRVSWYNGSMLISRAQYTANDLGDGVGTGSSKLQLTLSRGDLNAKFECRVESAALDEPILSWITTDVHVRPTKLELSGVKNHVVQGTNVLLICDVHGARPAATIRWTNGSVPITDESLVQSSPEDNRDGTYTTKSQLVFQASHWENGIKIHCYAENEVTKHHYEPEMHKVLILEVRYPPVISVRPKNITVNESTTLVPNKNGTLLICSYKANPQELKGALWSKDGKNLTVSDTLKFNGGTIENPPLIIYNVSRDDMGEYNCWLKNEVGSEQSEDSIFLNVQYPPDVEVLMDPSTPVKAEDKTNVLLECNVTSGNPSNLSKVRWFLDGELMKEFPECNYTSKDDSGGPFCGLDPSILSLERVDESFAGNYTCQGENVAGWGPVSEPIELIVYYPPSPAKIRYYPSKVVKKAEVNIECKVDHPGRPDNVSYIWYRGSHQMTEITSAKHKIVPVGLETRSNFTCIAVNEGGQSEPAIAFINVNAPPALFDRLKPYQGILYSSQLINLTCRVECFPLCNIIWKKDGKILDTSNNPLYYNKTLVHAADLQNNLFESIESTLIWNMTAWPGNKLNRTAPNSNYTCQSESNQIGPGVSSTIEIAVDYPPEDVYVTPKLINVIEGQSPNPVKCHGKGHPNLTYKWKKNSTSEPKEFGEELRLGPMMRSDSGSYNCEASNKHGKQNAIVYFNVQFAPECSITRTEKDGSPALLCTVQANPQEVVFFWKAREGNETYVESSNVIQDGLKSFLILDSTVDTKRTYQCFANNSVGFSDKQPCEMDVAGILPWWKRLNQEKLIIIIAAIIAIIICVIIICIVIIVLCRRKRASTKSPLNQSSTGDKIRPGVVPPVGGMQDHPLSTDPNDKGFYENLPFHGMQNPPNKPVSIIAPFHQGVNPKFTSSQQSMQNPLNQTVPAVTFCNSSLPRTSTIKRNQSFHGFQNNQQRSMLSQQLHWQLQNKLFLQHFSNPYLNHPQIINSPLFPHFQQLSLQNRMSTQSIPQTTNYISHFPKLVTDESSTRRVTGRNEANFSLKKTQSREKLPQSINNMTDMPPNVEAKFKKAVLPDKRFGSLKTEKHKCYSPTFYSMRCKKHAKKRPIVYALPKKCLSQLPKSNQSSKSDVTKASGNDFQNLTDSIQIFEQSCEDNKGSIPVPAPRCKKHKRPEIIYANICDSLQRSLSFGDSPNGSSDSGGGEISTTEVHVDVHVSGEFNTTKKNQEPNHNVQSCTETISEPKTPITDVNSTSNFITVDHLPKLVAVCPKQSQSVTPMSKLSPQAIKNSPILKVSPNFVKPKVQSPKGALSLQIQAKRKASPTNSPSDNPNTTILTKKEDNKENKDVANLSLTVPQMPLLSPQNKWNAINGAVANNHQNAFYTLTSTHCKQTVVPPQYSATIPHQKHAKLIPKALFQEQLSKSKSFSSSKASKHKRHFQIPLQKCHSFKFQTAESYFQPIKNIHEENLMRNGYVNDYPASSTSTSSLHHNSTSRHKERKPKQKTKGPLVLRHPSDYQDNVQFQENIQSSVQLQYPQPMLPTRGLQHVKQNGVVQYADLDMPCSRKSSHDSSSSSSKSKKQKPKTEYATLKFNDVGQEIDV